MKNKFIIYEQTGSVAIIRLNRPDLLNSFNIQMGREVRAVLEDIKENVKIRAVLLTGAGRAFCAGQDLSEVVSPDGEPLIDLGEVIKENYNPIIKLIREIKKPVVCGVNGVAAGAGANIALACDIVVAAESASFIQAFSKIGLIPDSGGTYFLPRLVGLPRAAALMMLGEKITAVEAFDMGMIYKVVPDSDFDDELLNISKKLSEMPTKALGLIKVSLNKTFESTLEEQLKTEEQLQVEAGKSQDYSEGVKAFLEKRKPNFKGK